LAAKKILFFSNAPAPLSATGYGNQAGLFIPRFAKAGYDVAAGCMTSVGDHIGEWEGITCLPAGLTTYSADVLRAHARYFFGPNQRGLVITLYDVWAITPEAVAGLACAAWTPIHSDPMSEGDQRFFALSGALPVAMSRYGEAQMRKAGLSPYFVPHGVDTQVFRPCTGEERASYRRRLTVPQDAFMVAAVGANKGRSPSRKGWPELLDAFAAFHRRHDEAVLFIHSLPAPGYGVDMRRIISNLDLAGAVIFSDEYPQITGLYPDEYIAAVEGCADVVANPSYGEGFGLAILQAQSCGTPVVVGNNTAQRELCGAGWKVPCQRWWYNDDAAWWHAPSTAGISRALEQAWQQAQDPEAAAAARARARAHALPYDADTVMERHWLPLLEMAEQYAGQVPVRPPAPGKVPLPTIEADGLRWLARGPHTDDWIAVQHEATLAPMLDALLPEGGVFLNVGAHFGRWALRLARKASRVVAVEASPDTAAALRYHIALNQVTNVDVVEVAAWDRAARVDLEDPNRQVTGGSTRVTGETGDEPGGGVEALPLDMILGGDEGGLGRLDLILLDVEGADLRALAGMTGLIAAHRPVLFIEDHSIYGYYEHADLVAALATLGYTAQSVTAHLPGDRTAPYVIAHPGGDDGDQTSSPDGN